jgi:tRNA pseudouridine38-40 synthase
MPTTRRKTKTRSPKPIKIKLILAYDGTAYQGWQIQKIGTGVQQKLEEALARIFPSRPRVHGSSRTDTGVHALGMVAHFEVSQAECPMAARKLLLALNAWLPEDIRILSVARAPAAFHARFSATAKQYRYSIYNHAAMNPLLRHTTWHVPRKLHLDLMRKAAKHFVGRHDFASFTANPGYTRKTTIRNITSCTVNRRGPLITVTIEGDGFLYKMCRGIVGTIVQAGLTKFSVQEIPRMLAQKDRRAAGMTAPAHGLVLWKVFYPKNLRAAPHPP